MAQKLDITVLSGVSSGDIFHFNVDENAPIKIGRNSDCNLVLQDSSVSRNHAQITLRSDGFFLSDLGSSGGTIHMGFRLAKGDEGARMLHDGDEFKIGEAIFRSNFDDDVFVVSSPHTAQGDTAPHSASSGGLKSFSTKLKKNKRLSILIGVVAAALLVFLLLPEEKKGLPSQKNDLIEVSQNRVFGYWRGEGKHSDRSHLDKVRFGLPGSDLVVDYDLANESQVTIKLDEAQLATIDSNPSWTLRQLIVRDLLSGKNRELVFDNLDYPRKTQDPGRYKEWGVRNARWLPLSRDRERSVQDELDSARSVAQGVNNLPANLIFTVRSVQKALLAMLADRNIDAVQYPIQLESQYPEVMELQDILSRMIDERKVDTSTATANRHLEQLTDISARLEAELWRRTNARVRAANNAASAKNWIEAHDNLLAGMAMFPGKDDYRYTLMESMFNNDKIVKKSVRQNPNKFRKKD